MISGALLLDAEVQVHAAVRRLDLAAPSTALRATLGTYGSFARFFNSAIARAARRPSLVAVEFELLGVVGAARLECCKPAAEAGELISGAKPLRTLQI